MSDIRLIDSIRVEVTGARGALGIDLQGTPTPGQFLVKSPGGGRTFNTASGTGADAGLRTDLAASNGPQNVGYQQVGTIAKASNLLIKMQEVSYSATDYLLDSEGLDITNALGRLITNNGNLREMKIPASPAGQSWSLSGPILIPTVVPLFGEGILSTLITAIQPGAVFKFGSGSRISDFQFSGNGVGQVGFQTNGAVNKVFFDKVRLQDFTQIGMRIADACNNSMFTNMTIQRSPISLQLETALNCTWLNLNSSLVDPGGTATTGARAVYIKGANNRSCRFIGGILERGSPDYQVAIEGGSGHRFSNMEINYGNVASAGVSGGDGIFFDGVDWTLNGTVSGPAVINTGSGSVHVASQMVTSGRGSRATFDLFRGRVLFNGLNEVPHMGGNFQTDADNFAVVSGGTMAYDGTNKCLNVTTTTSTGSGVSKTTNTIGTYRGGQIIKGTVAITNLSGGSVALFANLAATPFRRQITTTSANGLVSWSYVTQGDENGGFSIGSIGGTGSANSFSLHSFEALFAAA